MMCLCPLSVLTRRMLATVFLVSAALFCLPHSALGQSATATLSGTVEDENGAVIPGATVTLLNPSTALQRQTVTNEQGYFTITPLQPGTYAISVRRNGFTPIEVKNVVLNVGDRKSLQIQLKAGDISATVQVTNEAALINESPAVGTLVDRQFVENIPLNGRSFQSLLSLTPGVVLTPTNSNNLGQFSVNGQRANANYFTIDGVSANISASTGATFGASAGGAVPGLSTAGTTNTLVSVDDLQEFRVQTSTYSAEFGRQPGGQVQISTRSGTNDFRGTLFEYLRNEKLDANDWFANSRRLKRAPLRQNDFGGVIGGPILLPRFGDAGRQPWYDGRNRTFFFFSFEALRLRLPQIRITQVPIPAVRQIAPATLQPFLNAYPLPTGSAGANGLAEFATTYSDPTTINATSIRIDHTLGTKLSLFGRYNHAPSETGGRIDAFSSVTSQAVHTQTLTLGATLAISPLINNDFRFNFSRLEALSNRKLDDFGGAIVPPQSAIIIPASVADGNVSFTFSIGGSGSLVTDIGGNGARQLQRQINVADNLSLSVGTHAIKFGVDYRRLFPVNVGTYTQSFSFDSIGITPPNVPPPVGSVLSGRTSFAFVALSPVAQEPVFINLSIYGQDAWRVNRRLTFTYGLRWEVNPPFSEKNGNDPFTVIGLDNPATISLGPRGKLYQTTYNNFAPRLGLAYLLSQKPGRETMIRGGFGVFYDLGTGATPNAVGGETLPSQTLKILPFGTVYPPSLTLLEPNSLTVTPPFIVTTADPHLKLPLTYQWNFAVEQSIGSNQTISASYVGAAGRRLLRQEALLNPNPTFSRVQVTRNSGTSDYHAMQLQFQRRLSRGLQVVTSYTWSHSIDMISSDTGVNPPGSKLDPRHDRASSDFDVRHALTGAVTYNIPSPAGGGIVLRNWSLDTIFNARSATPVDIGYSRTIPGIGRFRLRPDLVAGLPFYIDDPTAPGGTRFNNTSTIVPGNPLPQIGPFLRPVEARQGTLARNALRGFGAWQIDFALRRQFKFNERFNLQLRTELFNVFNHPNFGNPDGTLTNNTFGQTLNMLGRSLGGLNVLYQVGGPRSVQLTLRLQF